MTRRPATKQLGPADRPDPSGEAGPVPVIRIAGGASAEEVAALVAVLSAVGGPGGGRPVRRSAWADPAWHLAGPGAATGGWRASSLPR
ncbi:acyl-CoA carboxylase epsilon subunit [Intrasporangium sp.]|uniref:acyl-CoA carboxylase epsilon subunit n=1 Tax=Intrasporangium sp. TaxID=1925024 RepID=UPI0032220624